MTMQKHNIPVKQACRLILLLVLLAGVPANAITFPDARLEYALRDALSKPTGEITPADMLTLTELTADFRVISDLSGLEYASNLTGLSLYANNITNIDALTTMTALTQLDLGANQISDITPLTDKTALTWLRINLNSLADISALDGLTNLDTLILTGNQIADISPLTNMSQLRVLDLASNNISNLLPLATLTGLEELSLYDNPAANIASLSNLNNLELLLLFSCRISDTDALSSLNSLYYLWLYDNAIRNLNGLDGLVNMQYLWLFQNNVADPNPLSTLINLARLDVRYNRFDITEGSNDHSVLTALSDAGAEVIFSPQQQGLFPDISLLDVYLPFDESSGSVAADVSGNANDGTLVNIDDSNWQTGYLANALAFDGNDDHVIIDHYKGVTGGDSRTVAAWIRTQTAGTIAAWGADVNGEKWTFGVQGPQGAIRVDVGGGHVVGTTDLRDNQWHHVAAVLPDDGSPDVAQIRLYVDGLPDASGDIVSAAINTAAGEDVHIATGFASDPNFIGLIDDFVIFSHALDQNEALQLAVMGPRSFAMPCGTLTLDSQFKLAADIDKNCIVDLADLRIIGEDWLQAGVLAGDIYLDRLVDTYDFALWALQYKQVVAPAAPLNLTAQANPGAMIALNWDDNTEGNLAYYNVYRGTDPDFTLSPTSQIAADIPDSDYADSDLTGNTTYYYRVTAVNTGGIESDASNEASATTLDSPIGLVAWWKLDDGPAGTVAVSQIDPQDNNAPLLGTPLPTWSADTALPESTYSLEFNGTTTNQQAVAANFDGILGPNPRSIALWMKTDNITVMPTRMGLVSWGQNSTGNRFTLRLNQNSGNGTVGAVRLECQGGYVTANTRVTDGDWHSVVLTFAGGNGTSTGAVRDMKIYVDGNLDGDITGWSGAGSNIVINTLGGNNVQIGNDTYTGSALRTFDGKIDEVMIYNRALSQAEITTLQQ